MKKLVFFFAICSLSTNSIGQIRTESVDQHRHIEVQNQQAKSSNKSNIPPVNNSSSTGTLVNNKYDYTDLKWKLYNSDLLLGAITTTPDASTVIVYSDGSAGYSYNHAVGAIYDFNYFGWGNFKFKNTDIITIDSLHVIGGYDIYNSSNADKIRFTIFKGANSYSSPFAGVVYNQGTFQGLDPTVNPMAKTMDYAGSPLDGNQGGPTAANAITIDYNLSTADSGVAVVGVEVPNGGLTMMGNQLLGIFVEYLPGGLTTSDTINFQTKTGSMNHFAFYYYREGNPQAPQGYFIQDFDSTSTNCSNFLWTDTRYGNYAGTSSWRNHQTGINMSYSHLISVTASGVSTSGVPLWAINSRGCVECDSLNIGDEFVTNGDTLMVVDRPMLDSMITGGYDLAKACVSHVTDMRNLLRGQGWFNQDISSWDVSNVTNMNRMFKKASAFNQNISNWDVGNVNRMTEMFYDATAFNQDLSDWCVRAFQYNAPPNFALNSPLAADHYPRWGNCPQDFDNITTLATGAFLDSNGCIDCSALNIGDYFELGGDTLLVVDRAMLDSLVLLHDDLSKVCVSHITDMKDALRGLSWFNTDISKWDVSNVTDMSNMFWKARTFNQDIGNWDVSKVTRMNRMFKVARDFNQDIGSWDVGKVERFQEMFRNADAFNQDLGYWNVSSVLNDVQMQSMFRSADNFSQDLTNWCVSSIASKPTGFDANSPLTASQLPIWGGCPPPASNLGTDTLSVCGQDSVLISARSGFDTYAWNTGETSSSIWVSQSGMYSVASTMSGQYTLDSSVYVSKVNAAITASDSIVCAGDSVTLTAGNGASSQFNSTSSSNLPSYLPTNGLVAWYPFNGNANDESGNGNDGSFNNSSINFAQSRLIGESCIALPNAHPTLVQLPELGLNIGTPGTAVTISLWARPNMNGTTHDGVMFHASSYPSQNIYGRIGFVNGGNNIKIYHRTSSENHEPASTNLGPNAGSYNDIWNHILILIDGANGTYTAYVNGVIDPALNFNFNPVNNYVAPNRSWQIGGISHFTHNHEFVGNIDDVGVWNRLLTTQEIQALLTGNSLSNLSYNWSTGDTTASITANPTQTTTYYCTVSDGITSCTDSLTVYVNNTLSLDLGADTLSVCGQDSAVIDAGAGYSSYLWSNGDSTQSITANSSGMYSCTVGGGSCTAIDSVYINIGILDDPNNVTVDLSVADTASFNVNYLDSSTSYQWQLKTSFGWLNLLDSSSFYVGGKSHLLGLKNIGTNFNGLEFRCIVTSPSCSEVSDSAILTVIGAGAMVSNPISLNEAVSQFIGERILTPLELPVSIRPNPTTGIFHVHPFIEGTYSLIDSKGRTVERGRATPSYDLSSYPNGVYILRLTLETSTHQIRVIKQ